ncbi:MAG TPA: transglycosylase SLT domain-containing protein, partial [Gemmatimonadales bacterium]|nr:transglycosylase SLT domain-containing protein [Gemmatimonadales bacterium]
MALALVLALAGAGGLCGQQRGAAAADRYDHIFRKYTKRYFGPAFDWRHFKAQGLAESGLDVTARSRDGARGIMQLMPSTMEAIQSSAPDLVSIDVPELNIAAGIRHDRALWNIWERVATPLDRRRFMFASYNAGSRTIARAQRVARRHRLDPAQWENIRRIAWRVWRWHQVQTLRYLR